MFRFDFNPATEGYNLNTDDKHLLKNNYILFTKQILTISNNKYTFCFRYDKVNQKKMKNIKTTTKKNAIRQK